MTRSLLAGGCVLAWMLMPVADAHAQTDKVLVPADDPGAFYASGCVPHDCGGNDGFMAVDPAKQTLYFARRGANPGPDAWPAVKTWPADVKEALDKALGSAN